MRDLLVVGKPEETLSCTAQFADSDESDQLRCSEQRGALLTVG